MDRVLVPSLAERAARRGGRISSVDVAVVPTVQVGIESQAGVGGVLGWLTGSVTWGVGAADAHAWRTPGVVVRPIGRRGVVEVTETFGREVVLTCVLDVWWDAIDVVEVVDLVAGPDHLAH